MAHRHWRSSSFRFLDEDSAFKKIDEFVECEATDDSRDSWRARVARAAKFSHGARCIWRSLFRFSRLQDRFLYLVEKRMARNSAAIQFSILVVVGLVLVTLGGLAYSVVWVMDEEDPRDSLQVDRVAEGMWAAWTFMADGGTHADKFLTEQRLVSALISIAGIMYMGIVLAVIVDLVREKVDSMRTGSTTVFESGHTLIVNWTDKTIPVVEEICHANKSEGRGCVVVLAQEKIEYMEGDLNIQLPIPARFNTQVVLRTGSPAVISDLMKVSAHKAKSIVVLANSGSADEADSATLSTLLSLKGLGVRLSGHIVAELRDVDNEPLIKLVGGSDIDPLVSHDVLGRLMIMAVRQPGLAKVYESVLGFEGHEFYAREWPCIEGIAFGELQSRFPLAVPLGVKKRSGEVILNPHSTLVIGQGDQLLVLAEDDDTYSPQEPVDMPVSGGPSLPAPEAVFEKLLICGWRRDIRDILVNLDFCMKVGSEVHIMTHAIPVHERDQVLLEEGLDVASLRNIKLFHLQGNTSTRKRLEAMPIETFTSCMIFADQSYEEDPMHSDSHSLATLLLIRDIQERRYDSTDPDALVQPTPMICEILDSRTQRTIANHGNLSLASDFFQSNKIVAQILSMIAENRNVKHILGELTGISGSSMLVVPPSWYVKEDEEVSFYTVAKRAMARNSIVIGYQLRGSIERTVLNPPDKDRVRRWSHVDFALIAGHRSVRSVSGLDGILTLTDPEFLSELPETDEISTESHEREENAPFERIDEQRRSCASMPKAGPAAMKETESAPKAHELIDEGSCHKPRTSTPCKLYARSEAHLAGRPLALTPVKARPGAKGEGAMERFSTLVAAMPQDERQRLAEAISHLGQATKDGTIFFQREVC